MIVDESEGTFVNARGQALHTYAFVPRTLRCILFFHHGFGEYSGREGLPAVFRRWAKAGIAVHTFDCHGHGKSEPHEEWDRFLVWDFNHLVDDLVAFTKSVRADHDPALPAFLGGHSMGSLASIHAVLRDQAAWEGLILGTATVDVEWNWLLKLQASIGSLLAMLIPRAEIVPAPAAVVTADDNLEQVISRDPLLSNRNVRARTANELLRAFAHVKQCGHLLWLPIYCHHGTSDQLASINAVKELLDRVASSDVTMHEIQGGAHELFIGLERDQVTGHVIDWIDGQLSHDSGPTAAEKFSKSRSLASIDCRPAGMSPASSVYGDSPLGGSPVMSPTSSGKLCNGPFADGAIKAMMCEESKA